MLKPYQIANIKQNYPPGTRIELDDMLSETDMPSGMRGTVEMVDGAGQLMMLWDNGRTLSLLPGEDKFRKIVETEHRRDQMKPIETEFWKPHPEKGELSCTTKDGLLKMFSRS